MKKILVMGVMILAIVLTSLGSFAITESEVFQKKRERVQQRVEEGRLSQEEANQIMEMLQERMRNCDKTGREKTGQSLGAAFRLGLGKRNFQEVEKKDSLRTGRRWTGEGVGPGYELRNKGNRGFGLGERCCVQ